ncbi:MAG: N-acetylneuraminate synthase family protein [Elusimicrobiota bacterium]
MDRRIFENLFVLEMTNNHLGSLERGLEIIRQFSRIVRFNNVKAAIKLQFRDVDNFVHKDFRDRTDIRYIRRTIDTKLTDEKYKVLVDAIKAGGCIPMSTPFDERSVDLCTRLDLPIIKVASSDSNDWILLEKIAKVKRPVIVSVAGLSIKDTDDLVNFFNRRYIPLALNHCVAAYPTNDSEMELNQLDFLQSRYPNNIIGLSSHDSNDNDGYLVSMYIAVAKGIRFFERHIDINTDGKLISQYSFLPEQIDKWFKAFKRADVICGSYSQSKKPPLQKEAQFLDNYIRGVYAKRDLPAEHILTNESYGNDIYLAIPLQKGQISCRELMNGEKILRDLKKDEPIKIDDVDSPYAENDELKKIIYNRGL